MNHTDEYTDLYSIHESTGAFTTHTVIVNGAPYKVLAERKLGFGTIMHRAAIGRASSTVTYCVPGNSALPSGTLVNGQSVLTCDGMVFNVANTDAA